MPAASATLRLSLLSVSESFPAKSSPCDLSAAALLDCCCSCDKVSLKLDSLQTNNSIVPDA